MWSRSARITSSRDKHIEQHKSASHDSLERFAVASLVLSLLFRLVLSHFLCLSLSLSVFFLCLLSQSLSVYLSFSLSLSLSLSLSVSLSLCLLFSPHIKLVKGTSQRVPLKDRTRTTPPHARRDHEWKADKQPEASHKDGSRSPTKHVRTLALWATKKTKGTKDVVFGINCSCDMKHNQQRNLQPSQWENCSTSLHTKATKTHALKYPRATNRRPTIITVVKITIAE